MNPIDRQAAFSGTKTVSASLRVDAVRLHDYLVKALPAFTGPLALRQFKGGQSNPTYLVEMPERSCVLRRKPPGVLLPSAHAVDREFRVIGALHKQGFPVPEPILYCGDEAIAGTPFYLMSHADGRVWWNPHMPDAEPAARTRVYDAMNATLARLHSFDPETLGLSDFGRGENYVARQVARWSKQYRASQTEEIDAMERLIAWLPDHLPPPAPIRLVHGDYRLDNIVVAPDGSSILAVLDWELSTLGDPLADFTYHLMTWHMPADPSGASSGTLAGRDLAALGIPPADDYVAAYASRTGLDPRPHLDTYLAYNFFRIAAILQGVAGRVRDGTATSEHAPAKARLVRPLAETAWRFATAAGA